MDAASIGEWTDLINDNVASWVSIFGGQQIPMTPTTQAAIQLEQHRQTNQTILFLGLGALVLYAMTRR